MRAKQECSVCLGKWDPTDDADYELNIDGFEKTKICWDCHCNGIPHKKLEFVPEDRCLGTVNKITGEKNFYCNLPEFEAGELEANELKNLLFCLPMTKKWTNERLEAFLHKEPKIEKDIKNSLTTWRYEEVQVGECDFFEIETFDSYGDFLKSYKSFDYLFPPEAKWKITNKFLSIVEKPLLQRFNESKRKLESIESARDILTKMARRD